MIRNLLCGRLGWHAWRFRYSSNPRQITTPNGSMWVCNRTDRCRRCGLSRRNEHAPVKGRVRA